MVKPVVQAEIVDERFQPVSTGSTRNGCAIFIAVQQDDSFSVQLDHLVGKDIDETGAEVSFVGRVRATERSEQQLRRLVALELEHYASMTLAELGRICEQASHRWELHSIVVFHRVGRLEIGERIVQVDVTSSHRESAFDACRFVMDFFKDLGAVLEKKRFLKMESGQWIAQKQSDRTATDAWGE